MLLYGVLGLMAMAAGALAITLFALPAGFVRDRIVIAVKEQTGRDLVIAGPASFTVFPSIGLSLEDVSLTLGGKKMEVNGSDYVKGLRDWVERGDDSVYALSPEEVAKRVAPRTDEQEQAFRERATEILKGGVEKIDDHSMHKHYLVRLKTSLPV